MSYISPNKIVYPGECCPALVTGLSHLLPFQVISNGAYTKMEYSLYGEDSWSEITLPVTTVMTDGFFIHSYNGEPLASELPCGVYEFRLTAGETWYFEPIMIEDFDITITEFSKVDELMTPFKFTEQIIDTTPLIAPCDRILPFMFRTDNVTSGSIVVTMVDSDGAETALSITVSTGVIDGKTYYWHRGECLYPFLTCGKYYLKIVDGANTYYSVPFVPECGISDIPDGYQPMRDMNGCVMRDTDGTILYEECSDIPDPEPPIEEIKYGYLYNGYAATDRRNIAASGWHVPAGNEIIDLLEHLDSGYVPFSEYSDIAGGKLKETGTTYWLTPNTDADNETGFNARGSAFRGASDGIFYGLQQVLYIWCSDVYAADETYVGVMGAYDSAAARLGTDHFNTGFALRLIKDTTALTNGQTGTYTGNDGKIYRTICIGTREWLADNLCETKYRNGTDIPEVTVNATWAALATGARCSYDNDESNAFTI